MHSSDLFDVTVTLSPGTAPIIVRGVTSDQIAQIDDAAFETMAEVSWAMSPDAVSVDAVLAMLHEMRHVDPPAVGDRVRWLAYRTPATIVAVLDLDQIYVVIQFDDQTFPRVVLFDETSPVSSGDI